MTSSSQFNLNTVSMLDQQQLELQKAEKEKIEQIERLREVQESLTFESGKISKATEKTLEILTKAPFQSPLKHRVQIKRPSNPSEQMMQLITLAKTVENGKATQVINDSIKELNESVGTISAEESDLEQEVDKIDETIEMLRKKIKQRKETIDLTKKQTKELQYQ